MTPRATDQLRSRLIIPAARGLPDLDAAAVWIISALRRLLRRGRRAARNAWEWVDAFDDLRERVLLIQQDENPPANCCPLVPVRMPVEVDVWPEPGEAVPLEFEERELGAQDNRRLVGKVAKVLIDHIALHHTAAVRYRRQAQRNGSAAADERGNGYALEVRARGRKALRGIDLDELARAVKVEVEDRSASESGTRPFSADQGPKPDLEIQFPSEKLAVVTEGSTTVEIRGPRQVWVFKTVVEADGRTVSWDDLVRTDLVAAGAKMDRRGRRKRNREPDVDEGLLGSLEDRPSPRFATRPESLQRTGNRIKRALGKLSYHWHQDGRGARWSPEVS